MASVNNLHLLGRLGKDVELKSSNNGGQAYADFSVATEEYDGKKDGKSTYKTQWFNCRAFGPQAEYASKNGKKGMVVYAEGSHTSNKGNDGKEYWVVKVNTFLLPVAPGASSAAASAPGVSDDSTMHDNAAPAAAAAAPTQSRGAAAAARAAAPAAAQAAAPAAPAAAPAAPAAAPAAVTASAAAIDTSLEDELPF